MEKDPAELAGLENLIGYVLRRAQVAVSRSFVEIFSDFDIRQTQLGVLTVIDARPGITPSRVGRLLGIKRTNVGPLLEALEARGLLRREPSADDRRSQALSLTEAGRGLLRDLRGREAEHETRIAAALTPRERETLLALLKRVEGAALAGMREDADEAAE